MSDPSQPGAPPSAAWGPPKGTPPSEPARATGVTITLLPSQLVALAGGVVIVVSTWLDWIRPSRPFGPAMGFSAYDVPAQFLFLNRGLFESRRGPSLGLLIFFIGLVCLVAALARPVRFLALPAGIGSITIAVWYAVRLRNDTGTLRDLLGAGAIVAVVGGVAAVVGGILAITRR
jgi:hypothetical protein